jgi:hypothetical protein
MSKQFLEVASEQFLCLRIDKHDFPIFIDDEHRVWRQLKQITDGDGLRLRSKLMPQIITFLLGSDLVAYGCLGRCSDIARSAVHTRDTIIRMFRRLRAILIYNEVITAHCNDLLLISKAAIDLVKMRTQMVKTGSTLVKMSVHGFRAASESESAFSQPS